MSTSSLPSSSAAASGGVVRQRDHQRDSWLWKVYITLQDRRFDRHFFDSTYGGTEAAEAMGQAWRLAMLELLQGRTAVQLAEPDFMVQLDALNAHFDTLRPRWIYVRVHELQRGGQPFRLRYLVSDRGQEWRRKESAVNFQAHGSFEATLKMTRARVRLALVGFFGEEVAAVFMAIHDEAFQPDHFDRAVGITIRQRLDLCQPAAEAG